MDKKKITIIVVIGVVILLGVLLLGKGKEETVEEDTNNETRTQDVSKFTEKEQEIIKLIEEKSDVYKKLDEETLESFIITNVINVGYYEGKDNIRYVQISYDCVCKDGSTDCDKELDADDMNVFYVEFDRNDKNHIKITDSVAENTDPDWVQNYSSIDDNPIYI